METVLGIMVGVGLSAACGFRIFVPLLVAAAAAFLGHLELAPEFAWLGSGPALVAFGVATAVEIGAYYVPWIDNLLDGVATPIALIGGVVLTAACAGEAEPLLKWSLALIAGGGSAGVVQGLTVSARAASSAGTGGLANPVLSTIEAGASTGLSLLSLLLPLVAAILVLALVAYVLYRLGRWLGRRRAAG